MKLHADRAGHIITIDDFPEIAAISRHADAWQNSVTSAEGAVLHWLPVEVGGILFYRPSIAAIAFVQSLDSALADAMLSDALLALIMTRRNQLEFIRDKLIPLRKARRRAKRFARTCAFSVEQLRSLIFSLMPQGNGPADPDAPPPLDGFRPLPSHLVSILCAEARMTPDQLIDQEPEYINTLVETVLARNPPEDAPDPHRQQYFALQRKLIDRWKAAHV